MSDVMDNAARSAAAQTLPADPGKNISDTRTTTATAATTLSATATTARDTGSPDDRPGDPIVCPRCGAPMHVVMRNDEFLFYGCTNFVQTGCRGRRFFERNAEGKKLGLVREICPECHQGLRKGIGKNGRPYCACFEKTDHKSGEAIFFNLDGTIRTRPIPKEKFFCPECNSPLAYFEVQNGRFRGRKTFACLEAERHNPKKAHYWEDDDGRPAW